MLPKLFSFTYYEKKFVGFPYDMESMPLVGNVVYK